MSLQHPPVANWWACQAGAVVWPTCDIRTPGPSDPLTTCNIACKEGTIGISVSGVGSVPGFFHNIRVYWSQEAVTRRLAWFKDRTTEILKLIGNRQGYMHICVISSSHDSLSIFRVQAFFFCDRATDFAGSFKSHCFIPLLQWAQCTHSFKSEQIYWIIGKDVWYHPGRAFTPVCAQRP